MYHRNASQRNSVQTLGWGDHRIVDTVKSEAEWATSETRTWEFFVP
jgi:hypothetical protein